MLLLFILLDDLNLKALLVITLVNCATLGLQICSRKFVFFQLQSSSLRARLSAAILTGWQPVSEPANQASAIIYAIASCRVINFPGTLTNVALGIHFNERWKEV